MDLDDATRRDLAAFFARRHLRAEDLARVARQAQIPMDGAPETGVEGWAALIDRAQRAGALPAVVAAAGRGLEGDKNFAELRALVTPRPRGASIGAAAVAAVVGATLAAVLALVVVAPLLRGAAVPTPAPTETPAPVVAPAPTEAAATPPAAAPAPAPDEASASPAVAPPPTVAPPPAVVPPAPTPARAPARAPAPGCAAPDGELVGWWYAGKATPGAQGATITLRAGAHVRADYPRADNGFSMKGRIRCTLSAGTSQRLSHAPVDIGNGHWWVPLYGGDLGP